MIDPLVALSSYFREKVPNAEKQKRLQFDQQPLTMRYMLPILLE